MSVARVVEGTKTAEIYSFEMLVGLHAAWRPESGNGSRMGRVLSVPKRIVQES